MPLTTKFILEEIKSRHWNAWFYYPGNSYMKIERADGYQFNIYSATPPTTSSVARIRAIDKYLTYQLLGAHKVPMPVTYLAHSVDEAVEAGRKIAEKSNKSIVVKPLDSGHGNGITVNIKTDDEVTKATHYALTFAKSVLIQEYVKQPFDIRLLCINYKFVAALIRMPARIQGDGVHTISKLIDLENSTSKRGYNYKKELNKIDKEQVEKHLLDKIDTVPFKDEWIKVLGTGNVGTGGETIDITNNLPDWFIHLAEEVSVHLELPVCGVDFLVQDHPSKESSFEELSPLLIEANHSPALFIHETPTFGKPRHVIKAYVDYLAELPQRQ